MNYFRKEAQSQMFDRILNTPSYTLKLLGIAKTESKDMYFSYSKRETIALRSTIGPIL